MFLSFLLIVTTGLTSRLSRLRLTNRFRGWLLLIQVLVWLVFITSVGFALADMLDRRKYFFLVAVLAAVAGAGFPLLRSILAGISIAWENSLKFGDYVSIGSYSGYVQGFGLRSVRLETKDSVLIDIPNYEFVGKPFTVLCTSSAYPCELELTLPSLAISEEVLDKLSFIAQLNPYAAPSARAEVFLIDSSKNSCRILLRGYVLNPCYSAHYRSEVIKRVYLELHDR